MWEDSLAVLEAVPLCLAVIKKSDHRIVWASEKLKSIFAEHGAPEQRTCHEFFLGNPHPCEAETCPLRNEGISFHDARHGKNNIIPRIQATKLDDEYYLYTMAEETALFRRIEYFRTLLTINRHLHSTLTLDEILSIVLLGITAGEGLGFNRAFILLPDEREENLTGHLALGPRDAEEAGRIWNEVAAMQLSLEDILNRFSSTLEENGSLNQWVKSVSFPLSDRENPLVRLYQDGVVLSVLEPPNQILEIFESPRCVAGTFHFHGISHGIYIADNKFTGAPFSEDTLEFLEILAMETGNSISTSILYNQLEKTNLDLKESQKRLVKAERLSALGEITAAVAHEIRNPIVTLGLILKNHRRRCRCKDEKDVTAMQRTLAGLERMLNSYLLFSTNPDLERERMDLSGLITDVIRLMDAESEERKVEVRFFPDSQAIEVNWDSIRIQEIFLNLFNNAYAAMPMGGIITITTHLAREETVRITFGDSGPGIPDHLREKIFDPYFTTKTTGTGIGLSLTSRIIREHGGNIWLDEEISEGTVLAFEIPREGR